MSRSLEILISKDLPEKWPEILVESPRSRYELFFEIKRLSGIYCSISQPENGDFLHISASKKDRFVFSDELYFDAIKNKGSFDFDSFYDKFTKIDFTLLLESKAPRSINSIQNLLKTAKILCEMGEGVIVFDQQMEGYLVDHIYQLEYKKILLAQERKNLDLTYTMRNLIYTKDKLDSWLSIVMVTLGELPTFREISSL